MIFSEVLPAIVQGWKPIELAQQLGVAPSFLSELLGELRTGLELANGIFPTPSDDEYRSLLESVARRGVAVPIVVDELGVIDGHVRLRALKELAHLVDLAGEHPDWQQVMENVDHDRADAVEMYGAETVEECEYLAEIGADLIAAAGARRWERPPIDQREGLTDDERRDLVVTLNAHRRHLTRGDLRLLIEVELMRDPSRTNVAIAALVGCTHSYVAQIRRQMEEDEARLANPQPAVEAVPVQPWVVVREAECPHCQHHLAIERAGRDFRLELTT